MEEHRFDPIDERTEYLAKNVVDCAYTVFSTLGPGLLESVYEKCLCHELEKRKIQTERQVIVPIVYDGIRLNEGLRLDILVEHSLIIELKAVEELSPLHSAQLITYLRLTGIRLGLLINFNVINFKKAVRRIIL